MALPASRWPCSAGCIRSGVVLAGLLFGALEAGAGAMQRDAGVPAVAVYVVEAVVIIVVLLADGAARRDGRRSPRSGRGPERRAGRGVMEPVALVGGFLAAAVRVATPLLLAATGETVTERSGVINLGLEGTMLAGALAATLGATAWGPWTGVALAVLAGMAARGGIRAGRHRRAGGPDHHRHRDHARRRRAHRHDLPAGLRRGRRGPRPSHSARRFRSRRFRRCRCSGRRSSTSRRRPTSPCSPCRWSGGCSSARGSGLALRATGESAAVARAAGVPTRLIRATAAIVGGGFAGLAGATLVLAQVGTFAERMTAGRGYVAIAIVVLGRWHPVGVAVAALLFGAATALQFVFQTLGLDAPYQLFLMLPYVLALLALAGAVGRVRAPADLGKV